MHLPAAATIMSARRVSSFSCAFGVHLWAMVTVASPAGEEEGEQRSLDVSPVPFLTHKCWWNTDKEAPEAAFEGRWVLWHLMAAGEFFSVTTTFRGEYLNTHQSRCGYGGGGLWLFLPGGMTQR